MNYSGRFYFIYPSITNINGITALLITTQNLPYFLRFHHLTPNSLLLILYTKSIYLPYSSINSAISLKR